MRQILSDPLPIERVAAILSSACHFLGADIPGLLAFRFVVRAVCGLRLVRTPQARLATTCFEVKSARLQTWR